MNPVLSLALLTPPAPPEEQLTVSFMDKPLSLWVRRDDHISRVMKKSGKIYEHDLLERLFRRLMTQPSDSLYLDIGAFIGTHSLVFARHFPCAAVVAIEPERHSYRLLCCNASALPPKIMVMRAGCGHERGEYTVLRRQGGNAGMTRLRAVDCGDDPLDIVDVVRVDDIVRALQIGNLSLGLMKIDVEGMEGDVLRGAAESIATLRPVVVIELQTPAHKAVADRALMPHGYACEGPYCATPTYVYAPKERR